MIKLTSLAAITLAIGCVPDDDVAWKPLDRVPFEHAPTSTSNIVGGSKHAGNPETALLLPLNAEGVPIGTCSSTLVGSRLLLTAAHCVDDTIGAAGFAAYFGTDFTVETDPGFQFLAFAEALAIHPAWNPADITQGNDIAVIQLAQNVPIAPRRVRTSPLSTADVGASIELVGWGVTATGATDAQVKRRAVSPLVDFDQTLVVIGNGVANTCQGDSGGPAFLGDRVAGITSFGGPCEELGAYTRVDAFLGFLGATGVDVTPDPSTPDPDPTDPVQPDEPVCTKPFGCEQNAFPDEPGDGGCNTGRGSGFATLLVLGALISAGRRRRRRPSTVAHT